MNKVFKRLIIWSSTGFTLVETLIAIALVGFFGLIVTGGMQSGTSAYSKVVEASNAELLSSMTLVEIRGQLATTTHVKLDNSEKQVLAYRTENEWRSLYLYNNPQENPHYFCP